MSLFTQCMCLFYWCLSFFPIIYHAYLNAVTWFTTLFCARSLSALYYITLENQEGRIPFIYPISQKILAETECFKNCGMLHWVIGDSNLSFRDLGHDWAFHQGSPAWKWFSLSQLLPHLLSYPIPCPIPHICKAHEVTLCCCYACHKADVTKCQPFRILATSCLRKLQLS